MWRNTLLLVMADAEAKRGVDLILWGRQWMMTASDMQDNEDGG